MGRNASQTRPDRKKADSLLVYAKFSHQGSIAPLNVILRLYMYTAKSEKVALVIGIWAYGTINDLL